ncbi:MAG: hypothetical protein GXP10_04285 [Gammaproteobacteria bacterium]|nr:hypothetical protein [Gammaproteobacteria bacterium]
MLFEKNGWVAFFFTSLLLSFALFSTAHSAGNEAKVAVASGSGGTEDNPQMVMVPFQGNIVEAAASDDVWKHEILFVMGVLLLTVIITTAVFGVRMAIFGADVFVPHMVLAGISVFLAVAHSVVAIVWFFPF